MVLFVKSSYKAKRNLLPAFHTLDMYEMCMKNVSLGLVLLTKRNGKSKSFLDASKQCTPPF